VLCCVSLAGAEEEEKDREEPILLWQKTYEGVIDFSMTDDGSLIFLNETKKTGDECITARYLVDSTGIVIRYGEGARAIITSDGTMVINLFDGVVEDLRGGNLAKVPFSLSPIEIPIFSPHKKYVAITPGYEANYPFLRVYEVSNGQQIWQMPIEKVTDAARFIILASFVTDESLVVFFDDNISLYDTKTGEQYWQRSISDLQGVTPNSVDFGFNELVTANSGDIAFFYRQTKFPEKPKDLLILTGKIISMDANGDIRWKIDDIHTRVIKLSPKGNYLLIEKLSTTDKLMLWDNRKG
jgi:outer membrane protein assembly factor BamB